MLKTVILMFCLFFYCLVAEANSHSCKWFFPAWVCVTDDNEAILYLKDEIWVIEKWHCLDTIPQTIVTIEN